MDTDRTPDRGSLVEVAVVLVIIQGAILVVGAIEAMVFASFVGPGGIASILLTVVAAGLTLGTACGLARHRRLARRWALVAETWVLLVAGLDTALSFAVVGTAPGPVLVLSRVVIPLAVIALLRRPIVRAAFVPGGVA